TFFFIIAGFLAGSLSFRIASDLRPIARQQIVIGSLLVSLLAGAVYLIFEYQHFAAGVGEEARFAEAKNAMLSAARPARSVELAAEQSFKKLLKNDFPPGGLVGYIRWAISGGELKVAVDGSAEQIVMPHAGFRWLA